MVLFFLEIEIRNSEVDTFLVNEMDIVEMERKFLDRDFSILLGDIYYFYNVFKNDLLEEKNIKLITDQWINFSFYKKIYDHICYIDVEGHEVIRINYDDNGSYKISSNERQNESYRSYFKESMKLSQNDIYISSLNLNVKNDEVELPYKPILRMSIAVKDDNDITRGTIVMSYLAKNTLDIFRLFAENSQDEVFLVNDKGYSISSLDIGNCWNFAFDERKRELFSKHYLKAWDDILLGKTQILTGNGVFTTQTLDFSEILSKINLGCNIISSEKWYIISFF